MRSTTPSRSEVPLRAAIGSKLVAPETIGALRRTGAAQGSGGNALAVPVSDNGPGVPAADRDLIFARFSRSSGNTTSLGSGLGLAISKEIVQRLGGRLSLGEKPPPGAEFLVEVPLSLENRHGLAVEALSNSSLANWHEAAVRPSGTLVGLGLNAEMHGCCVRIWFDRDDFERRV